MNKKVLLEDYKLGFADAEKEFINLPDIFDSSFYDPHNLLDKLMNSHEFLLVGRKGVGKSAYSCKLRCMSKDSVNEINTISINLSDFGYSVFEKLKLKEFDGTRKYKLAWDLTLLIEIYKNLYELHYTENQEINGVYEFLENNGIILNNSLNESIKVISKNSFNFKIKTPIFEIENGKTEIKNISNEGAITFLINKLNNLFINSGKILFVIDGLDDILRYKRENFFILGALVRSIDGINQKFKQNNINIKFILLIRNDILDQLIDPDLNKIKRDGVIEIIWNKNLEHLRSLAELRLSNTNSENIGREWYDIFPKKVRDLDSFQYVLQHTLSKPRDIIQFLVTCQKLFPKQENLNVTNILEAIKVYSSDYFFPEMSDELAGFLDDDFIINLRDILKKLGNNYFSFTQFKNAVDYVMGEKYTDPYKYKNILQTLFNCSYIGIYEKVNYKTGKNAKSKPFFKHLRPNISINYDGMFTIHKGLYKALNL
ncbi:P-loop ATPase, Sll1717 family [Acetoanaerobium sticklandii]|uniref:P-loop ATPase, Sll1717 family n=1 Tax=Acetoanaerobium sticklandii TaxID=1511 RepID=UPI003A8E3771